MGARPCKRQPTGARRPKLFRVTREAERMTTIAFIGLGNMGAGMAANLAKAGHDVLAFDPSPAALDRARGAGCRIAGSAQEAVGEADAVITMLPAGAHVRQVWAESVIPGARQGALVIDCSTIDVDSAR